MDGRVAQRNTQLFRASTYKSVASSSHPSCHTAAHTPPVPWRCSSSQRYACGPLQHYTSHVSFRLQQGSQRVERQMGQSRTSTRAHHASSRTAHRDARSTPHPSPPSTSPVRPESHLLLSSSHPVLHLHPFILDLSVLSSVVRYIQFVLLYVVSATVCCCLSLAFCCLSLVYRWFTAGLPLSAAAYQQRPSPTAVWRRADLRGG